jgi:NADH:ubiquinone oxidoreductase subunit 6 (subunit J)
MSAELVLFIIVAAVAIFAAAFMLVSRNAVHSALFLVVNFICVAFFYLMLSAPFLAMIQVTVYAGAIMVLFMFVIMLLGSEKLGGGTPKYSWIAPAAMALTVVFLIVAFVTIAQSQVGLLQPVPPQPKVQFIHTAAGAPAVDLYLNTDKIATDVTYEETTEFVAIREGSYNLLAYPTCTEEDPANCVDPIAAGSAPILAVPITLGPATSTAFVVAGLPDQLQVITVPLDLSPADDESTFRLVGVNALPESEGVSLVQYPPAKPDEPLIIAPQTKFGDVTPVHVLPKGHYSLGWQRGNTRLITIRDLKGDSKTTQLLILAPEVGAGGAEREPVLIHPAALRVDEAYGSPQQIGVSMLTTFLLPFELVSLLLLAAMVGAIILTREEFVKRVRQRLVVSPAVRRLNRTISGGTGVEPSGD